MDNSTLLLSGVYQRELKRKLKVVKEQCNTKNISKLVGTISKIEVIEQMQDCFTQELDLLDASNLPATIVTRTRAGHEYQKIALGGTGVPTKSVLSEGEQKIVALAGFFSLLDVTPNNSTIVLDDPITSLDHLRRQAVARRITEEAKNRPTIVFTHDPVFCSELSLLAEKLDVPIEYRTIEKWKESSGVVLEGLEWSASNVSQRIKELRRMAEALKQRYNAGNFATNTELSDELCTCYSKLRSAWERAVEAVLLDDVIKRMGSAVHTQKLKKLLDIQDDDINIVSENMSKCSRLTEAHDDPLVAPNAAPTIEEFESDIQTLDNWIKSIRKRRDK